MIIKHLHICPDTEDETLGAVMANKDNNQRYGYLYNFNLFLYDTSYYNKIQYSRENYIQDINIGYKYL